jgi:hypothetical protein
MNTDPCAEARDLLPAYSIGATTRDEAQFVERQMGACPDLAHELNDYQLLNDALLRDMPQITPPAGLLDKLLVAAAQDATAASDTLLDQRRVEAGTTRAAVPPPTLRPLPKPEKAARRFPWMGALAAALLIALLGSNAYWMAQVGQLAAERDQLVLDIAMFQSRQNVQTLAFEVMRAPDADWLRLDENAELGDPAPADDETYAWVIWSEERGQAVLMAQNFPALTPNTVYQLWGHLGNEDVGLTTFIVDERGRALLQVSAPTWGFDRYWITPEPYGGSPEPTGQPLVRARLG